MIVSRHQRPFGRVPIAPKAQNLSRLVLAVQNDRTVRGQDLGLAVASEHVLGRFGTAQLITIHVPYAIVRLSVGGSDPLLFRFYINRFLWLLSRHGGESFERSALSLR